VTSIGASDSIEAMEHTNEALETYARTQHIALDVLVDVEAVFKRARASSKALVTPVHHDASAARQGRRPSFHGGRLLQGRTAAYDRGLAHQSHVRSGDKEHG
jgi:hypothetical protein